MSAVSLNHKFRAVEETPDDVRALLKRTCVYKGRGLTARLLAIIVDEPSSVVLGTCKGGSDKIQLAEGISWVDPNIREVAWGEIWAATVGVRYLLRTAGLPYATWCSCPDWRGNRYQRGKTPVTVGLVDRRKEIPR